MSEQIQSGDKFTSEYNRLGFAGDLDTVISVKSPPTESEYVARVIEIVAKATGLYPQAITGSSQPRGISRPRHCVAYILRHNGFDEDLSRWIWLSAGAHGGLSFPTIGKYLHRDHTTVLSGVRSFQSWIDRPTGAPMKRKLAICLQALAEEGLA